MSTKEKSLPPGQHPTKQHLRWGKDHPTIGTPIPKINLKTYILTINGEVQNPQKLNWNNILQLPKTESTSDFHCVEGWSVLNNKWEGIQFKHITALAKPKENAKYVTFHCADDYTTSFTIDELLGENILLAYKLNEKPLEQELGYPLRLVVPDKYAYKSAMWITSITFTKQKELGYWEKLGYSDTANVWKNDRYTKQKG